MPQLQTRSSTSQTHHSTTSIRKILSSISQLRTIRVNKSRSRCLTLASRRFLRLTPKSSNSLNRTLLRRPLRLPSRRNRMPRSLCTACPDSSHSRRRNHSNRSSRNSHTHSPRVPFLRPTSLGRSHSPQVRSMHPRSLNSSSPIRSPRHRHQVLRRALCRRLNRLRPMRRHKCKLLPRHRIRHTLSQLLKLTAQRRLPKQLRLTLNQRLMLKVLLQRRRRNQVKLTHSRRLSLL